MHIKQCELIVHMYRVSEVVIELVIVQFWGELKYPHFSCWSSDAGGVCGRSGDKSILIEVY
jgi:hypothetical protein